MMKMDKQAIAYGLGLLVLVVAVYFLGKRMGWWGQEHYALFGPSKSKELASSLKYYVLPKLKEAAVREAKYDIIHDLYFSSMNISDIPKGLADLLLAMKHNTEDTKYNIFGGNLDSEWEKAMDATVLNTK